VADWLGIALCIAVLMSLTGTALWLGYREGLKAAKPQTAQHIPMRQIPKPDLTTPEGVKQATGTEGRPNLGRYRGFSRIKRELEKEA